jgi:hypothetical protein
MVAAAKVWRSGPAAAVVGALAITVYIFAATRYVRRGQSR